MDIWGAHVQNCFVLPGNVCNCVRLHSDCNLFGALYRCSVSLLLNGVLAEVHRVHLAAGDNRELALDRGLSRGNIGPGF